MSDEGGVVLLSNSKKEREAYENYAGLTWPSLASSTVLQYCITSITMDLVADLYAIFKTTEKLERAYVRDAISSKEYEPACQKLIGQYKTLWETLRDTVWPCSILCAPSQLQTVLCIQII